jgi:uncharacterized protein YdeI (YjbR/CyaY-like superfamily)
MEALDGCEIIAFNDAAEWESWLADHYESQAGMWMKIAKKSSALASVTDAEALDVALCYGWITGQRRPHDRTYYLQKFVPRRPKSLWSKVNIGKVEVLIAAGRMRPPGLAEIASAKADGRWDAAYESQKNATIPPDLADALAQNQRAKDAFGSLDKSGKYGVIFQLMTAKTVAHRAARLHKVILALEA